MRYVKGTINYGLVYSRGKEVKLTGFSDSNLAGDINDRRSTSGVAFYLCENVVTWSSQKQKSVALSSYEAEFMVATVVACPSIWLRGPLSR